MKKITGFSLILLLVMWLMPLDVVADNTVGDVNNDGEVNIADVNTVIDFILGDRSRQSIDVNGDGEINIADVNAVIGIILEGTSVSEHHEYVDLGLPSGTLWATCNVGASAPEEYGDYFAWGETVPKEIYYWSTYKWCNDSYTSMKKYCINSEYGYNGFTDGKTELDSEDDAAFVIWGTSWRMPTYKQQKELIDYCTWKWTQMNGVNGRIGTGPNGATIFFPAAGHYSKYEPLSLGGSYGFYWSRTLSPYFSNEAAAMFFNSSFQDWNYSVYRYEGYTVRPVRFQQN